MKIDKPVMVKPLIGFGDILLGLTKEKVFDLLGHADSSLSDEWPDGTISESWQYPALGLVLNFDSDTNYRLSTITVTSASAELDELKIIGTNVQALIEKYPAIIVDEDIDNSVKDYLDPDKEISFWVVNDLIEHITLFPEYDSVTDEPVWPIS